MDTEGGTIEETELGDCQAIYIKNPDHNILLWYEDDCPYIIDGNIPKKFLFEIASRVNLV